MALVTRHFAVIKKITVSSFNNIHFRTIIYNSHVLCNNYVHNHVVHGGFYQPYKKGVCWVLLQNLDVRSKFSSAKENKSGESGGTGKIQILYGDLLSLIHTESKVTKAVKYILKQDISVNESNMMYPNICYPNKILQKKENKVFVGRFTTQEDEIIKKKWNDLCIKCGIEKSELLSDLEIKVTSKDKIDRKQSNVIGCYLDPNVKKSRHATVVIRRAIYLLNQFVTGKYKPEEDKMIMEEVKKNGPSTAVMKDLCLKLNRNPITSYNIARRYQVLLHFKNTYHGRFELVEDKFIIEKLFMNKTLGIDTVNSIVHSDYKLFQEIKRNDIQVRCHFEKTIKPILLSYHYGKLDDNWGHDLLCYVIENKISSIKEITWKELLEVFPYQTSTSMSNFLSNLYHRQGLSDPLHKVVQGQLHRYKDKIPTEEVMEFRSTIVEMYLNCHK